MSAWHTGQAAGVKVWWLKIVSSSRVLFQDSPVCRAPQRSLSEADAIEIWIARWLRIRRKDLLARYGCDPRRIYEVWEGSRHPASRGKALELFAKQYPSLMDRVDFGRHQRISRAPAGPGQLSLFDI